jgi:hypothetical protein
MNSLYSLDEYYNNNSNEKILDFLDFVSSVLRPSSVLYLSIYLIYFYSVFTQGLTLANYIEF